MTSYASLLCVETVICQNQSDEQYRLARAALAMGDHKTAIYHQQHAATISALARVSLEMFMMEQKK